MQAGNLSASRSRGGRGSRRARPARYEDDRGYPGQRSRSQLTVQNSYVSQMSKFNRLKNVKTHLTSIFSLL